MAHMAELDSNNNVLRVIVVSNNNMLDADGNESEEVGIAFCKKLLGNHTFWKQTSYNAKFRKNYAGIGYKYDPVRDAFIPTKPEYAPINRETNERLIGEWKLNEETCRWEFIEE